jgi:glutathione synthase/RimK-type ligase-like ATP-grasp enzyme
MATIKILMCDGLNRSGLAVAKALKQADDFKLYFATKPRKLYEITENILNFHLINSVDTIKEGYSERSFADSLIEIIKRRRIDLILPVGNSVVYISKIKRYLESYSRVLVEDYEKLIKFHDKSQTFIMAKELDIPHPFTLIPKNVNDIRSSASKLKYPIVLKALKDSGADGVWYARSAPELIDLYLKATCTEKTGDGVIRDTSQPMLQEYIPGVL